MLFSPWFIKKFGKKKIKVFKNIVQIFLIASYFLFYENPNPVLAGIGFFIVYTVDRFVDTYNVIDSAIESDMRDNQQYLIGERIDGAFGFVSSYAGGAIGAVTGLFIPWVYKKKGFDGTDYSVLDVYNNYDETKPLSEQEKNPNCVLYRLMNTLLKISAVGAAIDVLPWFAYDITETGQKSMIRAIRIRTLVEDKDSDESDDSTYIEGCEAIIKARKYAKLEAVEIPGKDSIKAAKHLPANTPEEKEERHNAIVAAKKERSDAESHNEEIEIAHFVMHEITRFSTEFGQKQLELCRLIATGGPQHFFDCADEAVRLAGELPTSHIKEERTWRKQEIKNAASLARSKKLAEKYYPDGIVEYDQSIFEEAYNLPDDTKENAKIRRRAMKEANAKRNLYGTVAAPYLAAVRTLNLYEGYSHLNEITADYDRVVAERNERLDRERAENERLAAARRIDKESREREKKLRK